MIIHHTPSKGGNPGGEEASVAGVVHAAQVVGRELKVALSRDCLLCQDFPQDIFKSYDIWGTE